jgi:hypothetical protein
MPDYTPVYSPSKTVTLTASGAISGGDVLEVAGSGTVRKCTTATSQAYIGCAGEDTPSGGRVTVFARGYVHESIAEATVTAGDQLVSSNTGNAQVKTLPPLGGAPGQADVNSARAVMGVALTTATNPAKVRWMEW